MRRRPDANEKVPLLSGLQRHILHRCPTHFVDEEAHLLGSDESILECENVNGKGKEEKTVLFSTSSSTVTTLPCIIDPFILFSKFVRKRAESRDATCDQDERRNKMNWMRAIPSL